MIVQSPSIAIAGWQELLGDRFVGFIFYLFPDCSVILAHIPLPFEARNN
jgi:hypothetical protein